MPMKEAVDRFCLFMAGLNFTACAIFVRVIDGLTRKRPLQPAVINGNERYHDLSGLGVRCRVNRRRAQQRIYQTMFAPFVGECVDAIFAGKQERIRISDRVHAGLAKARKQGRIGGRRRLVLGHKRVLLLSKTAPPSVRSPKR
jgi:hypothetical protein